jgi:hypothetical protein
MSRDKGVLLPIRLYSLDDGLIGRDMGYPVLWRDVPEKVLGECEVFSMQTDSFRTRWVGNGAPVLVSLIPSCRKFY